MTLAKFTLKVMKACHRASVFYLIENPEFSKLFTWGPMQTLLERHGSEHCLLDQCCFGMPYRKSTKLMGTIPGLSSWTRRCQCIFPHERVNGLAVMQSGDGTRTVWKTSLSSAYPAALCRFVALRLARLAPDEGWRREGEGRLLDAGWTSKLCVAAGYAFNIKLVVIPRNPRRSECPWEKALKFVLDDGSRDRRRQAAEAREGHQEGRGPQGQQGERAAQEV